MFDIVEGDDDIYPSPGPFDPLSNPSECFPGPGSSIPYAGTPPGKYTVNFEMFFFLNVFVKECLRSIDF